MYGKTVLKSFNEKYRNILITKNPPSYTQTQMSAIFMRN